MKVATLHEPSCDTCLAGRGRGSLLLPGWAWTHRFRVVSIGPEGLEEEGRAARCHWPVGTKVPAWPSLTLPQWGCRGAWFQPHEGGSPGPTLGLRWCGWEWGPTFSLWCLARIELLLSKCFLSCWATHFLPLWLKRAEFRWNRYCLIRGDFWVAIFFSSSSGRYEAKRKPMRFTSVFP